MTISFSRPSCRSTTAVRVIRVLILISLNALSFAQIQPEANEAEDTSGWSTFASRGGWSIRYPSNLHISSCRQCEDPTAPEVPVAFSEPSGQIIVMVESLADKTAGLSSRKWLTEIAHDTVLSPPLSEQWTFVDGAQALTAINGASGSLQTENIYVAHGLKTFAIRFPHIRDSSIRSLCQQMASTFRWSKR